MAFPAGTVLVVPIRVHPLAAVRVKPDGRNNIRTGIRFIVTDPGIMRAGSEVRR